MFETPYGDMTVHVPYDISEIRFDISEMFETPYGDIIPDMFT